MRPFVKNKLLYWIPSVSVFDSESLSHLGLQNVRMVLLPWSF